MSRQCRLCKGELEFRFKSIGLINVSGRADLFENEYYIFSKCDTRWERAPNSFRIPQSIKTQPIKINYHMRVVDEATWKDFEENHEEENRKLLEEYEQQKRIKKKGIQPKA